MPIQSLNAQFCQILLAENVLSDSAAYEVHSRARSGKRPYLLNSTEYYFATFS